MNQDTVFCCQAAKLCGLCVIRDVGMTDEDRAEKDTRTRGQREHFDSNDPIDSTTHSNCSISKAL